MAVLGQYDASDIIVRLLESQRDKAHPRIELISACGMPYRIRANTYRLQCLANNQNCVWCGRKGSLFRLEQTGYEETPHLNLYHLSSNNNKLVLMTMDHLVPRSKGGKTHLDNLAVMCSGCNGNKKNDFPLEFVFRSTGWYGSQKAQRFNRSPEYLRVQQFRERNAQTNPLST